jgi:hypothetical protein
MILKLHFSPNHHFETLNLIKSHIAMQKWNLKSDFTLPKCIDLMDEK